MTRIVFNLIIAVAFFLSSPAAFSAEQPEPVRIACVGDSITFGAMINDRMKNSYPSQLATMLGDKWTVMNFGFNGATLINIGSHSYQRHTAFKMACDFNPNIVIIKLGTNDSKPNIWKHKGRYVSDYISLIKSFQKLESKPTVWICYPVPAYPGRWEITDKVIKEEVMPLIDEVAKKADVKIIDLYSALSNKKKLFPDTVHPNAAGAKLIAETVRTEISGKKSEKNELLYHTK